MSFQLIVFCGCSHYYQYLPICIVNEKYIYDSSATKDPYFEQNLKQVLLYYNEDYKVGSDGSILIPSRLYNDNDLLYNYTKKAKDSDWLENHQIQDWYRITRRLYKKLLLRQRLTEKIEGYIFNLYFTKFEDIPNANRSFFSRTRSLNYVISKYSEKNEVLIKRELTGKKLLIFENEFFGIIIFAVKETNGSAVQIDEFLIRPKNRIRQTRSGAHPNDCR